jgi:hypothetical protein
MYGAAVGCSGRRRGGILVVIRSCSIIDDDENDGR